MMDFRSTFLIPISLLASMAVNASPTANEFVPCQKLAVAALEQCLKSGEYCWAQSRARYDACQTSVVQRHARAGEPPGKDKQDDTGAPDTRATTRLNLTCAQYRWRDIEALAAPYLEEDLQLALTMQALSANYRTAAAATQVLNAPLPQSLKALMQALIDADC